MILRWYLKHSWERGLVSFHGRSYSLRNVLVNQEDSDIFSFGELVEGRFYGRRLRLGINYEEVLLLMRVDMSYAGEKDTSD